MISPRGVHSPSRLRGRLFCSLQFAVAIAALSSGMIAGVVEDDDVEIEAPEARTSYVSCESCATEKNESSSDLQKDDNAPTDWAPDNSTWSELPDVVEKALIPSIESLVAKLAART